MNCKNIIFLLLVSNLIVAMEHEPRTKIWRVDKEIQCEELPTYNLTGDGPNQLLKDRLKAIGFNKQGTEIIAWNLVFPLCFVWDRYNGELLARIEEATRSNPEFDKPIWKDRIPESHYPHVYPEEWGKHFNDYTLTEESDTAVLAIKNKEYKVCVWDKKENKEILQLVHENRVNCAHFNRQGIEIVTASHDGAMRLWHSQTGQELLRRNYASNVTDAQFNTMGTEIVVVTEEGKIEILVQEVK